MLVTLKLRIILWVVSALMPIVLGLGLVGFVLILALSSADESGQDQQSVCSASWNGDGVSERSLSQVQLDAAAAIYAAATETGAGARGAVVAIATALQESDLGANETTKKPNADVDVGVFQQRAKVGWYADGATVEENTAILNDVSYAARTFFKGHDVGVAAEGGNPVGYHIPGLLDIDGWESMEVTQAAQEVQVSAFPDAYAKHEPLATSLVTKLSGGEAGPIVCGPSPAGDAGDCPVFDASLEVKLTSDAIKVLRCGKKLWPQLVAFSVFRPGDPRDHGTGRGIDLMIPDWRKPAGKALGKEIADYFQANAAAYGITYLIWDRQIWSVARAGEGWRNCNNSNCYNGPDPTAAHEDHVHLSVLGDGATSAPPAAAGPGDESTGEAILPVPSGTYRISAVYGQRGKMWSSGYHTGLDFAAPTGTEIRSVVAGTVEATSSGGSYGLLTKLRVDSKTVIYYGHQSQISVTQGQKVSKGQRIGAVGSTGNSSGPHLHFEIRVDGRTVDPAEWLTKRGAKP